MSELRDLLTHIGPGVRVVMLMSQCYSGGFANVIFPDGVEIAPTGNVCGYFSAPPDRKAHGRYPEASGKETLGHSHRMFDALPAFQRLPDAQREVLVTDGTPDVPHATTGFFLDKQLERNPALGGHETAEFVDMLLVEAWEDPLTWRREIRLLDRVGQTFGFSSSRSLEQLDDQTQHLSTLRGQLDIDAERWERALDALQHENTSEFHAAKLEVGDIVLGPPGAPFQERHGLRAWVMQSEIGRPLTLRLSRDGREIEDGLRIDGWQWTGGAH